MNSFKSKEKNAERSEWFNSDVVYAHNLHKLL